MSSINSQLGVKDETTAGTAATVDRFFQATKIGPVKTEQVRLSAEGLRSSGWVELASQERVAVQGGTLPVEIEWMTKGMGWWLKHLLGGTATTGPTDSAYTHTGTVASHYGDSFTAQFNAPLHPAGTAQPITAAGCKIPSFELSCDVDGLIMLKADIDCTSIVTSGSLESASYPSAMAPYGWVDVAMTVGGSSVPVTSWTVKVDNGLKTDRYFQRGSALKSEQTNNARRKIEVEYECDFDALATAYNRVRATAAASAHAAVVLTATCADSAAVIGSSTSPTLTITVPSVRHDEIDGVGKEAPDGEGIMTKVKGVARWDGSNSPITIAYVSADSTA